MSDYKVNLLRPLTWLFGIWHGQGTAEFPTFKKYLYENKMKFNIVKCAFDKEPIIHFEEIAWVIKDQKRDFIHWETGYFKPEDDGSIQFYLCHNTGRIEITHGKYRSRDSDLKSFTIFFESNSIRNDKGAKVVSHSKRELKYHNNKLLYALKMATEEVPELTHHLQAEMEKVDNNQIQMFAN